MNITSSLYPSNWWNNLWKYRKEIRINHSTIQQNLINFPVLFSNVSQDYINNSQPNGNDFVFISYDNQTKYHHEIECYNASTGEIVAWVNLTKIFSNKDTKFWLYYGNLACENQENIEETWDNHFKAVYHMNSTYDSSYHRNILTDHSTSISNGKTGFCREFHGSDNSFMEIDDEDFDLPYAFTIMAWYQNNGTQTQYATVLNKEDINTAWDDRNWWISFTQSTDYLWFKTSGNDIDINVGYSSLDDISHIPHFSKKNISFS